MKIVILCTQLEGGGAQRASFKITNELKNRGICAENWFLYRKRDNFSDIGTIRVCLERPIKNIFDYFKVSVVYYKLLKETKPDVVIAFTHYANVLGLLIAYLAGIKIRIASHRNPSWGDMSKILMVIDNVCAKTGIYTSITAVSKSTKESFNYYPNRISKSIKVINNGFEKPIVDETKLISRQNFDLPVGAKIIGTIGRLSYQKNQKLLIECVAKLENVHLAIAGDGELKEDLLRKIEMLGVKDRVHLLGEIKYDQVPRFLNSIDIFVMPSLFEGLSNALVEAMSMGIPVITSDVPSQRDVVVDENGVAYGILLPADDPNRWANTIRNLFDNTADRDTLSKQSVLRASHFSIHSMVDGFMQLFDYKFYKSEV